jgi:hypothetical protein
MSSPAFGGSAVGSCVGVEAAGSEFVLGAPGLVAGDDGVGARRRRCLEVLAESRIRIATTEPQPASGQAVTTEALTA